MKKFLFLILLFPLLTFAQAGELKVGEQTIIYDSSKRIESGTLYYSDDFLVASEHGTFILLYADDYVILEAHDISGDGNFDTFITLNENGEVTNIEGEEADYFTQQQPVTFEGIVARDLGGSGEAGDLEDDLVGPLDPITILESNNSKWFFIFLAIFIAGSWWHVRNKDEEDE